MEAKLYPYHKGMKQHFYWCNLYQNWVDLNCCRACDEDASVLKGTYKICPDRDERGIPPEGHIVNLWLNEGEQYVNLWKEPAD